MRIALIADAFPPMRSSAAVQLRDLAREFVNQGHHITVFVPSAALGADWVLENGPGIDILRLKSPPTKDVSHVRRVLGEWLMPYRMLRNFKRSNVSSASWDGVVWYAPSIFWGPLVKALKQRCGCRSYLIVRDIFPEWAVDMGLLRRGMLYHFFKMIERQQYSQADTIGVQTQGNIPYLQKESTARSCRLEVLQNWLAPAVVRQCPIRIDATPLRGRKIFVYAGNMGIAQGMGVLLDLAERLRDRSDVGFLFVGRGSDAQRLRAESCARKLDNTVFFDEIEPEEIPGLYEQCHIGVVSLDQRHRTHNIPGKFLSYMQSGLPVLACINPGNDLIGMIRENNVGAVCSVHDGGALAETATRLLAALEKDADVHRRCLELAASTFSPATAVRQIVSAL